MAHGESVSGKGSQADIPLFILSGLPLNFSARESHWAGLVSGNIQYSALTLRNGRPTGVGPPRAEESPQGVSGDSIQESFIEIHGGC